MLFRSPSPLLSAAVLSTQTSIYVKLRLEMQPACLDACVIGPSLRGLNVRCCTEIQIIDQSYREQSEKMLTVGMLNLC